MSADPAVGTRDASVPPFSAHTHRDFEAWFSTQKSRWRFTHQKRAEYKGWLLFPNTKPEPGDHLQEQHNQKHDALAHYLIKEDGHLYRQLTAAEKERGRVDARRVVCDTEIFDTIREWHLQLGHAGVNKVSQAVIERFYGIRKDDVEWVLKHCQTCLLKRQNRSQTPARASREPVVSGRTLERIEIDLIDFRHEPDGEYKWILQIKDHFSTFISLFPLKSQRPEEVAAVIAQWIGMFGHPEILQFNNSQEFKDVLLAALKEHAIEVVSGPTTAQVQGSVEQGNHTMEVKIQQWKTYIELTGFSSKKWTLSLPWVALAVNQQPRSSLGQQSPYEVFFNRKPRREIETRLQDISAESADPNANIGANAGEDRSISFSFGEREDEEELESDLATGDSSSQREVPKNETPTTRQSEPDSPPVPSIMLPSTPQLASRPSPLGPPPPIPPRPRDLFPNLQPQEPLKTRLPFSQIRILRSQRRQPNSDPRPLPLQQPAVDSDPQPAPQHELRDKQPTGPFRDTSSEHWYEEQLVPASERKREHWSNKELRKRQVTELWGEGWQKVFDPDSKIVDAMGYRAWDHLWNLAKVVPQVSEATRAVNLTTAIRIGEMTRRPARGGTRTLIMSPVDIKNAKINFGLEAFKAEMVRYQHQPSRIAEVDTDSDTSEFVPMSQTLDAVSSQQAPDSNSGPLASASQQPADSDRQPVSSQRSLGSEPVLPQQPNPTEQMMQKGDADKAAIGAGRRGKKRKFNAGPSSERVLRKRVRGG